MPEELIRIPKFKLDDVSLTMGIEATKEDWANAGTILGKINKASQFWIGDWYRCGRDRGWASTDLLDELEKKTGLARQTIEKYGVLSSKISKEQRRSDLSPSHHQEVTTLLPAQQTELLANAATFGWSTKELRDKVQGRIAELPPREIGFFYVIATIPERDSRVLKLGYTDQVARRLKQHQTTCPTAQLKKSWACKFSWEVAVRDCLTSSNCKSVGGEVFECEDIPALLKKGDEWFALMPKIS